jgi:hypothetical protein
MLTQMADREPNNEAAWFLLGLCAETNEEALHCINRVISIQPDNKPARRVLAWLQSVQPRSVSHIADLSIGLDAAIPIQQQIALIGPIWTIIDARRATDLLLALKRVVVAERTGLRAASELEILSRQIATTFLDRLLSSLFGRRRGGILPTPKELRKQGFIQPSKTTRCRLVELDAHLRDIDTAVADLAQFMKEFAQLLQPSTEREAISRDTQIFVWQRDRGRCVNCGSQENLEFDHIIPVSKGGSNSARNIQLLCAKCNRAKGVNIGH